MSIASAVPPGTGTRPSTTRGRPGRVPRLSFVIAVAPALVLTVGLLWVPMSQVIGFSFTNFDGFLGIGEFVGLANYRRIVTDPGTTIAAANTAVYAVFYIVVQLLLAFLLALLLTSRIRGSSFYRSVFFLPVVVSPVAAIFVWSFLYDPNTGSINVLLRSLGLDALAQDWLGNFDLALYSVILVDIWKNFGYFVVIFVAGFATVPQETLEAARVDGAGWWRTLVSVIVPQMKLTIGLALVLGLNGALRAFDTVFLLTGGGPGNATDLWMTKTFREAFTNQQFGFGSAMAVVVLVILLFVAGIQRRLTRQENSQ